MTRSIARLPALAVSFAVLVLTGCATTHGSLTSSADKLQRNAEVLARNSRDDSSDFSRDARELAGEARDFRLAVTDRRADDRDVHDAFERLSKDYHAVRDNVERTHSRQAEIDLRPVTDAYLDIERAVGPPVSDRYARDRDPPRDRY